MKGYVVVFEGDDEVGYSAYSPELPGVVAAGSTRQETEHCDVLSHRFEHQVLGLLTRGSGRDDPRQFR